MFLYHITKEKNLDKILTEGLLINSENTGFIRRKNLIHYQEKWNMQPIFLTNDVEFIIKTQLTEEFIHDCFVLKIDVDSLQIEDEYEYLKEKWNLYYNSYSDMVRNISKYKNKLFICKHNIDKKFIIEYGKYGEGRH